MAQYPRKDADARTGSNLPGAPLLAHRQAQLAREKQAGERLVEQYTHRTQKLFPEADLRRAAEIREETNREWRQASVRLGDDAAHVAGLKKAARQRLERRLARELPGYRQWQTIQNAHLRGQDKVTQAGFAARRFPGAAIDWGDVVAVEPGS